MLRIGQAVTFVDRLGVKRDALITAVWDGRSPAWQDGLNQTIPDPDKATINLVVVSDGENEHDQYGRQITHESSIVHHSNTTSPGFFWQ